MGRMIPDPATQVTRKLRACENDEYRPRRVARRHYRAARGAARAAGIGKEAGAVAGHKGRFARCARTGEESTTNRGRANATFVQQIRA